MISIVDFGSQTTHLIGRRLADIGVNVEIVLPEEVVDFINKKQPTGIILSGGPASIYANNSPQVDKKIFSYKIPILGICYGWQLIAHYLGGKVVPGRAEYGPAILKARRNSTLLSEIKENSFTVWMSHGDEVVKLPKEFINVASTNDVKSALVENTSLRIFGTQFHPEVKHTEYGREILTNFVVNVCGESVKKQSINIKRLIKDIRDKVNHLGNGSKVVGAVSGGVDSTVAAVLTAKAIGKRFIPVYCDNGLMRVGTRKYVEKIFKELLRVNPIILDCKKEFLRGLKGITDPEEKRKVIGKLYIDNFEKVIKKRSNVKFLLQGTIYSDVIESKGSKHSSKIKSHHNVGGLPQRMRLTLLEPLRNFYKDEVREIGKKLGLPRKFINRQPFPGPGQAIRIIGEVTKERLKKQQLADEIAIRVLKETGWYDKVFQSFPVLTGVRSTAVKGDARVYGEVIALRVYSSGDIMTAGWTHLPYDVLQKISSTIVNSVPDVSRVVYDITTKPPATMEWE